MVGGFSNLPISQIVNVNWGGGAIAIVGIEVADSGSTFGRIYRGTSQKAETDSPMSWEKVKESNLLAYRSISYALVDGEPTQIGDTPAIIEVGGTPTFLLGGGWLDVGEIYQSTDAKDWNSVTRRSHDGGMGFAGIVWDQADRAFFAVSQMRQANTTSQVQLWRSSNGSSWSMMSELTANSTDEDTNIAEEITQQFLIHATKPQNRGGSISRVPDGYQAYDPHKDIFMTPTWIEGWSLTTGPRATSGGGLNSVTIKSADDSSKRSLECDNVIGVSFAGGVWTALGFNGGDISKPLIVFCSIDDGKTWPKVFDDNGYSSPGIVSGAKADQKKTESES